MCYYEENEKEEMWRKICGRNREKEGKCGQKNLKKIWKISKKKNEAKEKEKETKTKTSLMKKKTQFLDRLIITLIK